jgi:hypothetical protein
MTVVAELDSSEARLRLAQTIRVVTERSVWTITPTTYKREYVGPSGYSTLDASLDYDVEIPYRESFLGVFENGDWWIRLVPSSRPRGSWGVRTGHIQEITHP